MSNSEKARSSSRVTWIDHAKGWGIFLVVVGHVLRGLVGTPAQFDIGTLKWIDSWIYSFHMPLFFFLSGLFAPRALSQPPSKFFFNKLRTILYPYVIWSAILGLLRVLSGQGSKHLTEFALSFWRVIYQPTDIFWFLYALFLISTLYYTLRRFKVSKLVILVVPLVLSVIGCIWPNLLPWSPLNRVMLYSAYFAIAATTHQFFFRLDRSYKKRQYLVAMMVSFSLITLSVATGIFKTPSPNLFVALSGIIGILSLSVLSAQLPKTQVLQTFGTYSLQIYVAHTAIGALVRTGLFKAFNVDSFWIHFVFETLTGLYIPIALALISLKVFPYLFFIPKKKALAS